MPKIYLNIPTRKYNPTSGHHEKGSTPTAKKVATPRRRRFYPIAPYRLSLYIP
jgi:hypothetical protein